MPEDCLTREGCKSHVSYIEWRQCLLNGGSSKGHILKRMLLHIYFHLLAHSTEDYQISGKKFCYEKNKRLLILWKAVAKESANRSKNVISLFNRKCYISMSLFKCDYRFCLLEKNLSEREKQRNIWQNLYLPNLLMDNDY